MIAKKVFAGIFLLVLLALMPIALAEDSNSVVDANTANEIKTMNTLYGAEVRMLQLEKSITRNILVGSKVIEVIQANHPEADVNEAQTGLNQLEALLDDVTNFDLNQDKNTLVTNFVAMKKEATDLAAQFREITAPLMTAEDKQAVKDSIGEIDRTQMQNLNQQIKEAIRTANADRVEWLLKTMGVSDPELVQAIEDGNATKQQVKEALKGAFNDLNAEEKKLAAAKVREQVKKRIAAEKYVVNMAMENGWQVVLEREANKLERLSEWMHEKGIDANANGFENRAQRMENISKKMDKFQQKIRDWNQNDSQNEDQGEVENEEEED